MKLKNGAYLFLLLLACKDGGTLVEPSRSTPSGWIFNQALASSSFSNPLGLTFSNNPANQFSSNSNSSIFSFLFRSKACLPIASYVEVNANSIDFQPARCGEGVARWFDPNGQVTDVRDFYSITTSRTYGNIVEVLSFAFWGKEPKSGTYSINQLFFSQYSIFVVSPDGSGEGIASYRGFSGVISAEVNRGFLLKSDDLKMIEGNDRSVISLKVNIGCCSN
jgi:hypothetical protein